MTWVTRRDPFQAIADPTRRAILGMLLKEAKTPNELAEHFDCSRQAVSKHIGVLVECGLVTQRPSGRVIYYHLDTGKMREVDAWLEPFRKLWSDRFTQLDDVLKNL
ncbi:ArsR/SmtB family transcription factor [Dinghuibacter silviterrae]|uniref:ArsR family transcriptional regulator n=1 Tax=Dinghuibacter silviterrae TaxID=1539049 RepID=A0A4R8DUK1_9BACT|nr:metalloregulator ArsR/SmtB family transcription factor [Dinghuibacter silviterrae]TDX02062.1 ArsR family transcriptional regulator [Dinghuibacter silviterrae]